MRVPHLIGALAVLASAVLLLMPVPEGVPAGLLRGAGAVVLGTRSVGLGPSYRNI